MLVRNNNYDGKLQVRSRGAMSNSYICGTIGCKSQSNMVYVTLSAGVKNILAFPAGGARDLGLVTREP